MSSICGIIGPCAGQLRGPLHAMLNCAGGGQEVFFPGAGLGLSGTALPLQRSFGGHTCTILFDGELYNSTALKQMCWRRGFSFTQGSDAETVLALYLLMGQECPRLLGGAFAFAVYDQQRDTLFFARDRMGEKPLYFMQRGEYFLFSSEARMLLRFPGTEAVLDRDGLLRLLRDPFGSYPLRGIHTAPPGCSGMVRGEKLVVRHYWRLEAKERSSGGEEGLRRLRLLAEDAVKHRMHYAALLGGSSPDNMFPPPPPAPERMAALAKDSVRACGLPVSEPALWLLHLCRKPQRFPAVVWPLYTPPAPCSTTEKTALFCESFRQAIRAETAPAKSSPCPTRKDDTPEMQQRRNRFYREMQEPLREILAAADGIGRSTGLTVRTPFADHRLLQYVFNFSETAHPMEGMELINDALAHSLPRLPLCGKSPFTAHHWAALTDSLEKQLQCSTSALAPWLAEDAMAQCRQNPPLALWLMQAELWCEYHHVKILL